MFAKCAGLGGYAMRVTGFETLSSAGGTLGGMGVLPLTACGTPAADVALLCAEQFLNWLTLQSTDCRLP